MMAKHLARCKKRACYYYPKSQSHHQSLCLLDDFAGNLHAGGALGGDVLREAAIWGLSLPWGDVNSTGKGHAQMRSSRLRLKRIFSKTFMCNQKSWS